MKTRFLIITAILLFSTVSFGQKKLDPQKMADYQTDLMRTEMNLDSEQLEKVEELNLRYSKQQADLMNKEGSMFSKIGDMKKIKKAKNKELEKFLSKEQMEFYEDELEPKIRKTMREKMSEK
ncbi:hypothetical protein [Flagellimonas sp.]|uniref:hypothetical protein n=1 Tax=Flagellimonas sp. TaxID=2058762 RepID=UPI003F4A5304